METGETQWKERFYEKLIPEGVKRYKEQIDIGDLAIPVKFNEVKDFITQTIEALGRELAERQQSGTYYDGSEYKYVPMEDIYSVFKRYGVDIGGKGE